MIMCYIAFGCEKYIAEEHLVLKGTAVKGYLILQRMQFVKIYKHLCGSMDTKLQRNINKKQLINIMDEGIKQEQPDTLVPKKSTKKSVQKNVMFDEKDLLITQLQEQVNKQKECILYYESIVQLMNYKLMKLKKVLKAHQLLEELDS